MTNERLVTVMLDLFASEINSGMQSFWDGPFRVWLGDHMNGHKADGYFRENELDAAAAWLHEQALVHYPQSQYARENPDGK